MQIQSDYRENSELLDHRIDVELVNETKFTILYILSLGLYGTWWAYKSWRFFKQKDNLDIMPAMRAIFGIFFLYGLFDSIQHYAKSLGHGGSYSSGFLYAGILVGNIVFNTLPDQYALIAIVLGLFYLAPLRALNYAVETSDDYVAKYFDSFSPNQWWIVVIGGLFWSLIILGLFLPQA